MLCAVLEHGPVARSTIARLTGSSPAAVTRQYGALAELGLVTEVAGTIAYNGIGRPHIPVDIDTDRHIVAGIHIAHDYCTLAALDLRGRVLTQTRLPHESRDPERVLAAAGRRLVTFLAERLPGRIPLGLGVAIGGWVDPDARVLIEHASLGWRDVPIGELLSARTGLPVRVDSHARALARAEQLFGAVQADESVVHLFVGNVVDAAIVTSGAAHRGPRSAAGEIAHLALGDNAIRCDCGRWGCLEATVSDWSWAQRAELAGIITRPSIVDLVDAAHAGSASARESLVERAKLIGKAAALLFDIVNPEVLVVTELGVIQFPECLAALRATVAEFSRVCVDPRQTIAPSSFDGDSVLGVAAGSVQLDAIYADPLSLQEAVFPPIFPASGRT
jgi:predicted NBD/HSP70 family sugar kinase